MLRKKDPQKTYRDGPSRISLLGTASTMGMHMVSGPIVGGGLGYFIDHFAGSFPWGSVIGFVLGVVAGFRNVWSDYRRIQEGDAELDREEKARNATEKYPE